MAKKKSSKNRSGSGAISSNIASRRLPDLSPLIEKIRRSATARVLADRLRAIEDRRRFHPAGPLRSARSFNKAHHALRAKPHRKFSPPTRVMFEAPKKVLVCVRRQRRKEVIFAKGKNGGGNRPPRRNWFSDVSCRR